MPPIKGKQKGAGGLVIYGNFCGPFNSLPEGLDPIDAVDSCCLVHDKHYGNPKFETRAADFIIKNCLLDTDTVAGKALASVFTAKNWFDEKT